MSTKSRPLTDKHLKRYMRVILRNRDAIPPHLVDGTAPARRREVVELYMTCQPGQLNVARALFLFKLAELWSDEQIETALDD